MKTPKEKLIKLINGMTAEEIIDIFDYDVWTMANDDVNGMDEETIKHYIKEANDLFLTNA